MSTAISYTQHDPNTFTGGRQEHKVPRLLQLYEPWHQNQGTYYNQCNRSTQEATEMQSSRDLQSSVNESNSTGSGAVIKVSIRPQGMNQGAELSQYVFDVIVVGQNPFRDLNNYVGRGGLE